jgi:hypothetical protein
MDNGPRKIRFHDLSGLGPFFELNNIPVTLIEEGGRAVGEVEGTESAYATMARFQDNPTVPLLEWLAVQRRMRGRMLDVRDGNGKNGHRGTKNGQHTS